MSRSYHVFLADQLQSSSESEATPRKHRRRYYTETSSDSGSSEPEVVTTRVLPKVPGPSKKVTPALSKARSGSKTVVTPVPSTKKAAPEGRGGALTGSASQDASLPVEELARKVQSHSKVYYRCAIPPSFNLASNKVLLALLYRHGRS